MKRCRWKSFFDNPKSAIQNPKWLGLSVIAFMLVGVVVVHSAQQPKKVHRIGYLSPFDPATESAPAEAIRLALRELGYIDGQNVAIEYRYAEGKLDRLPELAAELVRLKPDVIVTLATPPSLSTKQATRTIPIVFAGIADPVGAGLITNFARPGGNITGVASISAELGGKRLGLLKEVTPKVSRVAVLYNPADRANVLILKQLQESAPALALTLQPVEVRGPGEFDSAFVASASFGKTSTVRGMRRRSHPPP